MIAENGPTAETLEILKTVETDGAVPPWLVKVVGLALTLQAKDGGSDEGGGAVSPFFYPH